MPEASVVTAVAESTESAGNEVHGQGYRERRRRRRKPRSFYEARIRPYRRELNTGALFLVCILLGYMLWTAIISR